MFYNFPGEKKKRDIIVVVWKGMNRSSLTWPLSKQGNYYLLTSYNDKSTMESERDYNIKREREK
jgi:hypothetical protein